MLGLADAAHPDNLTIAAVAFLAASLLLATIAAMIALRREGRTPRSRWALSSRGRPHRR